MIAVEYLSLPRLFAVSFTKLIISYQSAARVRPCDVEETKLTPIHIWFYQPTDKMKDAIIAKLANQAADFYGDAFKQCQYKENLPKVC